MILDDKNMNLNRVSLCIFTEYVQYSYINRRAILSRGRRVFPVLFVDKISRKRDASAVECLDPWTKGCGEHVADWLLMQH